MSALRDDSNRRWHWTHSSAIHVLYQAMSACRRGTRLRFARSRMLRSPFITGSLLAAFTEQAKIINGFLEWLVSLVSLAMDNRTKYPSRRAAGTDKPRTGATYAMGGRNGDTARPKELSKKPQAAREIARFKTCQQHVRLCPYNELPCNLWLLAQLVATCSTSWVGRYPKR